MRLRPFLRPRNCPENDGYIFSKKFQKGVDISLKMSIINFVADATDAVERNETNGAGVAQLAEQLICNQQVAGSIPFASSSPLIQETLWVGSRVAKGSRL